MNTNVTGCGISNMDCRTLAQSFFKQFDLDNKYDDCNLFSAMKNDLEKLCLEMNCEEVKSMNSDKTESIIESFFNNYNSLDKYINCHLYKK